jgi:phosphocarrier protein HPr
MSESVKDTVIIESVNGLHVRPASQIVKEAKAFSSDITFHVDGREASAKSLFKLQTLEMNHGKEILIHAEGTDAQAAVTALKALIKSIKE